MNMKTTPQWRTQRPERLVLLYPRFPPVRQAVGTKIRWEVQYWLVPLMSKGVMVVKFTLILNGVVWYQRIDVAGIIVKYAESMVMLSAVFGPILFLSLAAVPEWTTALAVVQSIVLW